MYSACASKVEPGEFEGTRYEIHNPRSTTSMVKIYLAAGQMVRAIPGCMVATSANIEIKGKLKKTFKALVGPDSATRQELRAIDGPGWVLLAPRFMGEVTALTLTGQEEVLIGDDAFLASTADIESTSKSQGWKKALFSGDGAFVKKAKGRGIVFIAANGGIMSWDLKEGEKLTIDNDHLVMWSNHMKYKMKRAAKGLISTHMSGEGMVALMTGPGRVWAQTRSPEEYPKFLYDAVPPPMPPPDNN